MRLGITLGDVAGIGPEILVRSLATGAFDADAVIYGPRAALDLACIHLGLPLSLLDPLTICDPSDLRSEDIPIGRIDARCGAAAVAALDRAIADALAQQIDAIVTLPINKQSARLSIPDFQGHTEHLAAACGVRHHAMMLIDDRIAVTHVSTHVALAEAVRRCREPRIAEVICLTHEALLPLRREPPRIAVAALNPHAGEGGAFGDEEAGEIRPAIDRARSLGIDANGPFPPDTVFMQAFAGRWDAVVAMYHDQGHIPMKCAGFASTVNVTLGLPILRVSVDHGTAFDIAYQGIADPGNFLAAVRQARRLAGAAIATA